MRILVALGLLAAVVCAQETILDAMRAYNAKDYARALPLFKALAEKGDTMAQHMYATMLSLGRGTKADPEASVAWLRKAAWKNYPPAMRDLGLAMWAGRGIKKNEAEGAVLIIKAADLGDATARCQVAGMYMMGNGVKKDLAVAQAYAERAARSGSPMGEFALAQVLLQSNNPGDSTRWMCKSAADGYPHAIQTLQTLIKGGRFYADIPYTLGILLIEGKHLKRDLKKGNEYLRDALKSDHGDAHWYMGVAYLGGAGIAKDEAKAKHHFKLAAKHGSAAGRYRHALNLVATDQKETRRLMVLSARADHKPAIAWLKKQAAAGDAAAAKAYEEFRPAREKVARWKEKIAAIDKPPPGRRNPLPGYMNELAVQLEEDGNYAQAVHWRKNAAKAGHLGATLWLARRAVRYREFKDAFRWWSMVRTPQGRFETAWRLEEGRGTDVDRRGASEAYWSAGRRGHVESLKRLVNLATLLSPQSKAALVAHAKRIRKRKLPLKATPEARQNLYASKKSLNHCGALIGDPECMVEHGVELVKLSRLILGPNKTYKSRGAAKFLLPHAEKGNGRAAHWLALEYLGLRKSKDARAWFMKAVEAGHYETMLELGRAYAYGAGKARNNFEARAWGTAYYTLFPKKYRESWYRSLKRALGDKVAAADARGREYAKKYKR